EYLPETGALGMSLIGGAGMFSMSIWNPVIGSWLQGARETAMATGVTGAEADLIAGQATLSILALIPATLILFFGGLYFYMRGKEKPAILHGQVEQA
ncbi:MAG: MFS transporter, partial [Bacteroidota bacterium]